MTVALGVSAYPGRDLPPDDARVLQGAAVPRRGLRDHRDAPRPGPAQHGRPEQVHARHVLDDAGRRRWRCAASRRSRASSPRTRSSRRRTSPRSRAMATLTSAWWPACSSPRSTRSGCSSWRSTARRAIATRIAHDASRRATTTTTTADRRSESPWVVTVPLILLAIPSVYTGWVVHRADARRRLLRQLDRDPPGAPTRCGSSRTNGTASARSSSTAC